jgi:hypothetical protein
VSRAVRDRLLVAGCSLASHRTTLAKHLWL